MEKKNLLIQLIVLSTLFGMSVGCKKSGGELSPEISPEGDVVPVNRTVQVQQLYSLNMNARLNNSRSDGWVQCASDGTLGMVYRETRENGEGKSKNNTNALIMNLIYKTIAPDGTISSEIVTSGDGVDKSVFVYDSNDHPHIFFPRSGESQQEIFHFYRNNEGGWSSESAAQFSNDTGLYIYELNAAEGPGDTLHLLALKTGRTGFMYAHLDSFLLYISYKNGEWETEVIENFDTIYLQINIRSDGVPYWYMRIFKRQDLAIDAAGHAHVAYGALRPQGTEPYPTELRYANNISGNWNIEVALAPTDESCDAGDNPSIVVDNQNRVILASTFIERVPAGSASYSRLFYSIRTGPGQWQSTFIADTADGYIGGDGGHFTGAMPHLALDAHNQPHIVFSDMASTHMWDGSVINIGQIRYARYTGSRWELSTLYRQPSPTDYDTISEMHGLCLAISNTGTVQIIGQEFISADQNQTYNLLHLILQ